MRATVSRVFPDRVAHDGAEHQHIWVAELKPLDYGADFEGDVFVAIRVTQGGIGRDIPFREDTPVELQGLFIPADEAQPGQDNQGSRCCTSPNTPVGFVVYEGQRFE